MNVNRSIWTLWLISAFLLLGSPAALAQLDPKLGADVTPTWFDIVTIEPSGRNVVVGIAEPGARIELLLGTAVIARAEANQLGEWMLALGDGLAPGTYELVIRITTADSRYQLLSDTLISVIVPETAAAASPPFAPQPAGGFTLADLQITIAFGVGAPVVVEGILTGPLRAIVQRGDTLWYIATQFYGDGALYPLIADANRDQIRNVHVLQPGQILLIPDLVGN